MEVRYIKLNSEEALFMRKQLLYSELDFLHLLKKLRAYRLDREIELDKRENLKKSLSELRSKILLLEETLPTLDPNIEKAIEEEEIQKSIIPPKKQIIETQKKIDPKLKQQKESYSQMINKEKETKTKKESIDMKNTEKELDQIRKQLAKLKS
jgi:hypothetical protein